MDYGLTVAIIVVLAAIGGFVVLVLSLLDNIRGASQIKKELQALKDKGCREFEDCFGQCVRAEFDDRDSSQICALRCRPQGDFHLCA